METSLPIEAYVHPMLEEERGRTQYRRPLNPNYVALSNDHAVGRRAEPGSGSEAGDGNQGWAEEVVYMTTRSSYTRSNEAV